MAVTKNDFAKAQLQKILRQDGYPTYARLLGLFDFYTSDNPDVTAYVIPDKAKIVMNQGFDESQVSTIIRHEILHEFLRHNERFLNLIENNPGTITDGMLRNYAADYEISNRGYTEKDKKIIKKLLINGVVSQGLITEDDHPDWVDKTFEEMYLELIKDVQNKMDQPGNGKSGNPSDEGSQGKNQSTSGSGESSAQKDAQGENDVSVPDRPNEDGKEDIADSAEGEGTDNGTPSAPTDKGGPSPFSPRDPDDIEEQEVTEEIAERIKEIAKAISSGIVLNDIEAENISARQKEFAAKEANKKEVQKLITENPLENFEISLQRFIKLQTRDKRMRVEDEIHPAYVNTGYFVPRTRKVEVRNIPLINVYWDVSGSFSDDRKTRGARKAIATLDKYERQHKIKTKIYYFGSRVSDTPQGAGGGTNGAPIQEHIEATKPTNVIIITDGDISDCQSSTVVPGAIWMLFYYGYSQNLMDHISGKMENKYYLIERGLEEMKENKQKKYVIKGKSGRILSSESLNEGVLKERMVGLKRFVKEDMGIVEVDNLSDETPKSPNPGSSLGISDLLISAINDEWETIRKYNDLIVNAQYHHFDDMVNVIQDIVSEENVHVGQLQKVLETLSTNTEDISKGELEAEEQLANPVGTE